jgi:predicted metal-dependent hydrolase
VVGADTDVRQQLMHGYHDHAEQHLGDTVKRYAQVVGASPKSVMVKHYKSRWGNCSIHGDIRFHWALIMALYPIVDYVVIHAWCHLHHHNHSPAFWQQVATVLPDSCRCGDWLKVHGPALTV